MRPRVSLPKNTAFMPPATGREMISFTRTSREDSSSSYRINVIPTIQMVRWVVEKMKVFIYILA